MWGISLGSRPLARKLILACWLIIAICGVFEFVQRDLLPYLLIQVDFAYFNHDESQAVFYVNFFAILIAVANTELSKPELIVRCGLLSSH